MNKVPPSAPLLPQMALPPKPRTSLLGMRWRHLATLWAWPFVLSLVFVLGVMAWLAKADLDEREARQAETISDVLSLEAQISGWLDGETRRLQVLADLVSAGAVSPDTFDNQALVLDGMRRFWVSVTWVDARGRIAAQVPDDQLPPRSVYRDTDTDTGMAAHVSVNVEGGGSLVARYSTANLLRQSVPWWLASKYDIRLLDAQEDVVAATVNGERQPDQIWYRKSLGGSMQGCWLELATRERLVPWWRSAPMALMAGFVPLLAVASWMLRQQMQGVARAEEAWRTEAAWRQAMEDSLAVGIRARDLDGRLIYVNRTMADMVGYTPEELEGVMPPMPYWPRDEIELAMKRHQRNMAGGAPRDGYESRWQHRDGRPVEVMVYEAPLVDAKGQQIGWMASVVNITERKRMEERERKQAEAMAHHARLTMLGEVASTLAHELNQPLSAIISYNAGVQNALQRQGFSDALVLNAIQRMGEQASHAGRIVKRIREFLTRREPQREPCDINEVVESAMGLLLREITRHGVAVSMQLDRQLPQIEADPVLIEQVAANLIRNACDAMATQKGPRRLQVQTQLALDGQFVKVVVTDNGPGLQGQTIEGLCAPFYSTKSDGMGMGLAICRSIVELHYGALDAHDAPGGGAVMSFSVPCRPRLDRSADDHARADLA
jgi:two-component system sensor histidine kinase DctS